MERISRSVSKVRRSEPPQNFWEGLSALCRPRRAILKISIPPVLPFFSGSLGFIQSYDFKDWKHILLKVFNKNYNLLLKNRIIGSYQNKYFNALNEIIVQRGRSPKILEFDILIDGNNITTIKADGIIISTSTGSTGYNLSAGGVLVHPSIDVILLTPICPFSLTFRPLILNSDANIKINLINGEACIQSDGKEIDQIKQGNILDIIKCDDPFKIINFDDNDKWYLNIKKKLNWGS